MWIVCPMCENKIENQGEQCPVCGLPLERIASELGRETLHIEQSDMQTDAKREHRVSAPEVAIPKVVEVELHMDSNPPADVPTPLVEHDVAGDCPLAEKELDDLSVDRLPGLCLASKNLLKRLGILTIGELRTMVEADELQNLPGLGRKKRDAIMDALQLNPSGSVVFDDASGKYDTQVQQAGNEYPRFTFIHPDYDALGCSFLKILGMSKVEGNVLNRRSIETIAQLKSYNFIETWDVMKLTPLLDKVQALREPLREIMPTVLFPRFQAIPEYFILAAHALGETLDEIGTCYNCTRERIRQKELKLLMMIHPLFQKLVSELTQDDKKTADFVPESFFQSIGNQECAAVFHFWWKQQLKKTRSHIYLDFASGYLEASLQPELADQLEDVRVNLVGDFFNLSQGEEQLGDAILSIQEEFPFVTYDVFLSYLEGCRYQRNNQYVYQGSNSAIRLGAELVPTYFPEGICFSDKTQLEYLRGLLLENFNLETENLTGHALESGMKRYLILCGKNRYIHRDAVWIDATLLHEILSYIEALPDTRIFDSVLFQQFESRLSMQSNISNQYFLHGVIVDRCEDRFTSQRDYLLKSDGEQTRGVDTSLLKKLLIEHGAAMHKRTVKQSLGIPSEAILMNMLLLDESLFQWEHNYINVIDNLYITQEETACLRKCLIQATQNDGGYTSEKLMYDAVVMCMDEFLVRNHIKTSANLFYVLTVLFPKEYRFRRPHIVSESIAIPPITTKSVLKQFCGITPILDWQTVQKFGDDKGWARVTVDSTLHTIKEDYVRVSGDLYLTKETFKISEEHLVTIQRQLGADMTARSYLATLSPMDYDNMPDIGYEWNVHLLISVIEQYGLGFKCIFTQTSTRRHSVGVIVAADFPAQRYDQFVAMLLKEEGRVNLAVQSLNAYLQSKYLMYNTLPYELYHSDLFEYKNRDERFILR